MQIRRLGWAGVEIEAAGAVAVIDLLEGIGAMSRFIGEPREALPVPSRPGEVSVALVTHLHFDHADPAALARALAPDAVVLRPPSAVGEGMESAGTAAAEAAFDHHGIPTKIVQLWESVQVGPFTLSAVPAADGFGDPQVSWVIAADGRTVIHCGDTLFHGWWWLTRMRYGPLDLALLPINGPVADLPHRQPPSELAVAMDPRQAVEAAALLQAGQAVPIHYGTLHNPPIYTQVEEPTKTFIAAAQRRGVKARVLEPGERMEI